LGGDTAAPGSDRVFIVPADGGKPVQIVPQVASALLPVWSPDSQHLLVTGTADPLSAERWYVVSIHDGHAVDTKSRLLELYGMRQEVWRGDQVIVSSFRHGPKSLWVTRIAPGTWRAADSEEQVASGTEYYANASASIDGQIVFSGTTRKNQVWSLPLDGELGQVLGEPQRITAGVRLDSQVAISADGKTACYSRMDSTGARSVYVKNLQDGSEVLRVGPDVALPTISADGSKIAYVRFWKNNERIEVVRTTGGEPEQLSPECNGCVIADWSHQNDRLLYYGRDAAPGQIFVLDVNTGVTNFVAGGAGHNLYEPRFSPDDRWLSFLESAGGKSRVWLAPLRDGLVAVDPSKWIAVTAGDTWDDKPRWSPGGGVIYYTSDQDGFVCLWGRRLHPATRQPVGPAFAVRHFHDAHLSMTNLMLPVLSLGVARDRLVFILGDHTANIWTTRLR
jgi:Tol biopolymer transport system component